jgi:hypothetical protein
LPDTRRRPQVFLRHLVSEFWFHQNRLAGVVARLGRCRLAAVTLLRNEPVTGAAQEALPLACASPKVGTKIPRIKLFEEVLVHADAVEAAAKSPWARAMPLLT